MSDLRSTADHIAVLRAALERTRHNLLAVWRDSQAQAFDLDVLVPLGRETTALERAVRAADQELDAAVRTLRNLGANF